MNSLEVLSRFDPLKPQKPKLEIIDVSSRLKLMLALSNTGIDWSKWGKEGITKPLKTLWKEIKKGESVLYEDKEGKIVRIVQKAAIDIIYAERLRLYEEFNKRGEWFRREPKEKIKKRGVQEKILPGETPEKAAFRGIKEEIGIIGLTLEEKTGLIHQFNSEEDRKSKGYPGLFTKYYFSDFTFELPERFYKPDGYIVQEEGFMTRLIWEKIV